MNMLSKILQHIKDKVSLILPQKTDDQFKFRVVAVKPEILKKYTDLHWFFTCLIDEGKQLEGIIYIGSANNDKVVEGYYYKDQCNEEMIIKFLNDQGIIVK